MLSKLSIWQPPLFRKVNSFRHSGKFFFFLLRRWIPVVIRVFLNYYNMFLGTLLRVVLESTLKDVIRHIVIFIPLRICVLSFLTLYGMFLKRFPWAEAASLVSLKLDNYLFFLVACLPLLHVHHLVHTCLQLLPVAGLYLLLRKFFVLVSSYSYFTRLTAAHVELNYYYD